MDFVSTLLTYFELPLVVLILVGTEFAKVFIVNSIKPKWITLCVGVVASIIYIAAINYGEESLGVSGQLIINCMISFFATTSCYDYIWKPIKEKFLKNLSQ
jgi:hypothetical protein